MSKIVIDSSVMDDAYCKECGECHKYNHSGLLECDCNCKLTPEELAKQFIEKELKDYIVPFS